VERRLHTRHRARTVVYITVPGGRRKLCKAVNLSATGVFIENHQSGLAQRSAGRARIRNQSGHGHETAPADSRGRARLTWRHRPHDGELRGGAIQLSKRTMPLEGFDGGAGSRTAKSAFTNTRLSGTFREPASHKGQASDHTSLERASYQVLWQPCVSEPRLNGGERCLHTAHRAAKLRP